MVTKGLVRVRDYEVTLHDGTKKVFAFPSQPLELAEVITTFGEYTSIQKVKGSKPYYKAVTVKVKAEEFIND